MLLMHYCTYLCLMFSCISPVSSGSWFILVVHPNVWHTSSLHLLTSKLIASAYEGCSLTWCFELLLPHYGLKVSVGQLLLVTHQILHEDLNQACGQFNSWPPRWLTCWLLCLTGWPKDPCFGESSIQLFMSELFQFWLASAVFHQNKFLSPSSFSRSLGHIHLDNMAFCD